MAEQEVEPAEIVHQPAEVSPVGNLLVDRAGALRVRASEHPVPLAVGDDRRLEVDVRRRAAVVQPLGELERALDVLARSLEVAAAAVAARAPGENVRAQMVGGELRPLGQLQRLVEEVDRCLDAGELVAGDAEPEEDVCALEVRETLVLGEHARAAEQLECVAHMALPHPRRRLAGQCPHLELRHPGSHDRVADGLELLDRLEVAARLDQSLRPRERRVDAAALVGRDAVGEVRGIDTELFRQPRDRLARRARLAALDLADVLLREAVAGELGLCPPRGDAELAEPLAEPSRSLCGCGSVLA